MRGAPTHPFEEIILPKNMFLAWEVPPSFLENFESLPKIKVGSGLVGCSSERQNTVHLTVLRHQIARVLRKSV